MNIKGKPPLEVINVRVTDVEISGDGEAWNTFKQSDFSSTGGGSRLRDSLSQLQTIVKEVFVGN